MGGHPAAGDEPGTLGLALLDVAEHPLLLLLRDLGALQVGRVGRVAVAPARETRGDEVDRLVVAGVGHEDP